MVENVQPAFDTLKKTYKSKKTLNVAYRKEQLTKLMLGLVDMKHELEEAIFKDMGRDSMFTEMAEIGGTMSAIKWDLKNIDWMAKNETIDTELILAPAKTFIKYEPLGVAAIYGAWNYPIGLTLKPLVQCITAGNCALIKPSEVAPATSAAIAKLI
jgi:aldehyde dehydrogenase (NAD+)